MITKPPAARNRDLTRPYIWACPTCGHVQAINARGVGDALRQARDDHACGELQGQTDIFEALEALHA